MGTLESLTDKYRPSCDLTKEGINREGRKFIEITVQDTGSGLAAINILKATNAEVKIPDIPVDENKEFPVVVTATKIDQNTNAIVRLKVTDVAGNITGDPDDPDSPPCDPVLTHADIPEGRLWVSETFTNIPQAERYITVRNGDPGLSGMLITVNGEKFWVKSLGDTEERTVDVASAMAEGENNSITLTAYGIPGASADITIADSGRPADDQPYVRWRVGRQLLSHGGR
jgi:hypothetical protein